MIKMERLIGPGFALSRNYILDTFDIMLFDMKQKVGVDKKDENFKFLVGETIIRTLGWEPGHGGKFQNVQIVPKGECFESQKIVLTYEEKTMNYYRFKQDYKPIIHSDKFTSINILRDLDIMLDRMDDHVRDRYFLKSARRRYQLRMGMGLYRKLKETVWNGSGFVRTYKDIPLFLDYDKDEEYVIELKFEEEKSMPPFERTIFEQKFFTPIQTFEVKPKKVIFSGPCTIVIWSDNTKTMVRRAADELDDPEKALALCLLKKNKELFKLCRKEAKNENSKREEDSVSVDEFMNRLTKTLDTMRGLDIKKEVFFDDRK